MAKTIDVAAAIDAAPMTAFQVLVLLLCGAVYALDGFDTQSIAFVAPVIAEEWRVPVASFGPVFGAGLFGLMVGGLVIGPLADRWGRRTLVIASTITFGLFSLASAEAGSLPQLLALRFLTGIGLGGAMPNIIALSAEYVPARSRTMWVTLMSAGFPLGAALGGILSAMIIPTWGWRSVFYVGGLMPLALTVALLRLLPESTHFLINRQATTDRIAGLLRRIMPGFTVSPGDRLVLPELPISGYPISALFRSGRLWWTLILWSIFFGNLLVTFFLVNWLPTILRTAGAPIHWAIVATVLLNIGGVLGGVVFAKVADRHGPYVVLTTTYLLGGSCVVALGLFGSSPATILLLSFFAGTFILGSQLTANSLAASLYPTAARSTGVGWALGMGRIGSIVGPVAAGIMIAEAWPLEMVFAVCAIPAATAALGVLALAVLRQSRRVVDGNAVKAPDLQPGAALLP